MLDGRLGQEMEESVIRDRVLWAVLALVLVSMAVSLWDEALVAGIAAGAIALHCAIAAIRGSCFGPLGAILPVYRGRGRKTEN